jgi:hypothetical protein
MIHRESPYAVSKKRISSNAKYNMEHLKVEIKKIKIRFDPSTVTIEVP